MDSKLDRSIAVELTPSTIHGVGPSLDHPRTVEGATGGSPCGIPRDTPSDF